MTAITKPIPGLHYNAMIEYDSCFLKAFSPIQEKVIFTVLGILPTRFYAECEFGETVQFIGQTVSSVLNLQ